MRTPTECVGCHRLIANGRRRCQCVICVNLGEPKCSDCCPFYSAVFQESATQVKAISKVALPLVIEIQRLERHKERLTLKLAETEVALAEARKKYLP